MEKLQLPPISYPALSPMLILFGAACLGVLGGRLRTCTIMQLYHTRRPGQGVISRKKERPRTARADTQPGHRPPKRPHCEPSAKTARSAP